MCEDNWETQTISCSLYKYLLFHKSLQPQFRWCQSVEEEKHELHNVASTEWIHLYLYYLASVVPLNASQTFSRDKSLHHLHRIDNFWKQIRPLCWIYLAFKTQKCILPFWMIETHLVCNIQRIVIWCETDVRLLLTIGPEQDKTMKGRW